MSPKRVGVAPKTTLEVATGLPLGKGWRVVAPGKKQARRAILMKKFKSGKKTLGVFHILRGTR